MITKVEILMAVTLPTTAQAVVARVRTMIHVLWWTPPGGLFCKWTVQHVVGRSVELEMQDYWSTVRGYERCGYLRALWKIGGAPPDAQWRMKNA